jgi:hypothetical protein
MAEIIAKLAEELEAREVICLEGVVGGDDKARSFYFKKKGK